MRHGLASNPAGAAVVILIATAAPVCAAELVVGPGERLQAALDRAADGDTVIVEGVHRGGVRIERKITLDGREGAVIDGEGRGSVVFVAAAGAVVRGLTLRGSGRDLVTLDAGVFVEKTATGTIVEANRIEVKFGRELSRRGLPKDRRTSMGRFRYLNLRLNDLGRPNGLEAPV